MLSTEGIPIWIDCDTGHDDAIALLLASHLPYFNLLGVSTVYGNSSLRNTTRNTLSVLTAYNRTDIKVYSGSDKPLKKPVCFADSVHGESGLDGTDLLPEPAIEAISPDRAVFAMKKAIDMFPGKIAIVATGCLTNIARLVMEYPESLSKIGRLSIMGGGFEIGNITEWAEFNIWCDPEAAEIVLNNETLKSKTMLVPLNLTHRAIATKEVLTTILHGNSCTSPPNVKLRQLLYEILTFFASTYKDQFGFDRGPPVHDPLAVLALLEFYKDSEVLKVSPPDIELQYSKENIKVTIDGKKRGMLTATENKTGVAVSTSMNITVFWDLVFQAIDNCESTTN